MSRPRLRELGLALAYAALWGIAVTLLESMGAALYGTGDAPALLAVLLSMWISRAAVLTVSAHLADGRLQSGALVLLFATEALLLSLAWDGTVTISQAARDVLGVPVPLRDNLIYNLWLVVVYGAPLFWLCLWGQRLRRTRDVLARAQIERSRTTALLDETQWHRLEGRIDSALLLRATSALVARYREGRESAEQLLDAFVRFLRLAMPGLRGGTSTLGDELALLSAHDELAALLEPGRVRCLIDVTVPPGERPFPPHLLLPLVERLQAAQGAAAPPPRVTLTAHAGGWKLVLDGGPLHDGWIGPDLTRRLTQALRDLHGQPGRWLVGGSPSLTLHLPQPPAPLPEEPSHDPERQHRIA